MKTGDHPTHGAEPTGNRLATLALAALGVVYGDIGTSPLYALKECFGGEHPIPVDEPHVLGVVSLFFWSLMLAISVKYLGFIMRADNHGEGGILALLALAAPKANAGLTRGRILLVSLGIFGAALLYGDGVITPAISVLSAVEGLREVDELRARIDPFIVPITVAILIGLFLMQKRGTARVGAVFGPATLIWFVCITLSGLWWIPRAPKILFALNPLYAMGFLATGGWKGFLVLGSVVLCITGGEALYADMGHFGRKPIRLVWWAIVLPALVVNYLGQGAHLLVRGEAAVPRLFYGMVEGWFLYPMIAIATVATVVASQALISGAYSLTRQAMQLGYVPRMEVRHTSSEAEGQIYLPGVNTALMIACVALVIWKQQSSGLAAAYGIAVTGTMAITSVLFYDVMRHRWGNLRAGSLVALFLIIDLAFFAANAIKIESGGWLPLVLAAVLFLLMTTWKRGRRILSDKMAAQQEDLAKFLAKVHDDKPPRVPGTAVFMTSSATGAPPVLLHHYKHNQVLHEQVVLLSIVTENKPKVGEKKRVSVEQLGEGFYRVIAHYGFMQSPRVREILVAAAGADLRTHVDDTSFYLGRESLLTETRGGMARWRKALFGFMSRNARPATAFFDVPPDRVVEVGMQIAL